MYSRHGSSIDTHLRCRTSTHHHCSPSRHVLYYSHYSKSRNDANTLSSTSSVCLPAVCRQVTKQNYLPVQANKSRPTRFEHLYRIKAKSWLCNPHVHARTAKGSPHPKTSVYGETGSRTQNLLHSTCTLLYDAKKMSYR
jgi:hypothetical protein